MRTGPRLLAMAVLLVPALASASVFDQFGFGPRDVAMGGAQVAASDDFAAAYYNPSLLVARKQFTCGLGASWIRSVMDVHPLSQGQELQFDTPPDFGGMALGLLFPMAGKVENRLALGLALYLPTNNLLRTDAADPNVPSWYFYEASPNRFSLALSAGVRITDWLMAGAGVQVLGGLIGGFQAKVDLFDQAVEERALDLDLVLRAAPLGGLTLNLEPLGVRVGFGYRAPIRVDYRYPHRFSFTEVGVVDVVVEGIAHYSPHTFTVGAQWSAGGLSVTADVRYALWSRAPDPSSKLAMRIDNGVLAALGAGERFDQSSPDVPPMFADTIEPHLGVEYWIVPSFAVRAGYSFRPTPVPLQIGDTNILDGDTHALSLGLGFSFTDPLEVFAKPVHIDLADQLLLIPERQALKSGGALPSYAYSGQVNFLTVAVRYEY